MALTQGYVYDFEGIDAQLLTYSLGAWYVISEDKIAIKGRMRLGGIEYDGTSSIAYINGPFSNPVGEVEYFIGDTWYAADLEPFIVPSTMDAPWYSGINLGERNAMFYSGWVSFEKSFGFTAAVSNIEIWVFDTDGGGLEKKINTISKNSGVYLPDIFTASDVYGFAKVTDGAMRLEMYYPQTLLQDIVSSQATPPDSQQISPGTSQGYAGTGGGDVNDQIKIKSSMKNKTYSFLPLHTWYIDYAIATGMRKILLPDGSVRLLVANLTNNKFDLYNVSNGGVILMFSDLWDETYHGAQLGYLLDGTLVSYAWKIVYTPPTGDSDALITYSLYFKRSLNDGSMWEIPILAKSGITGISGLPVMTQESNTGKIKIGSVYSNDMGLTWH